jgi:cytochrome P450
MPFSGGPRYCIGTSLALMQLKIALTIVFKRFRFILKPGTKVDCSGFNSIRPRRGLPMILREPDEEFPLIAFKGNVRKIVHFD